MNQHNINVAAIQELKLNDTFSFTVVKVTICYLKIALEVDVQDTTRWSTYPLNLSLTLIRMFEVAVKSAEVELLSLFLQGDNRSVLEEFNAHQNFSPTNDQRVIALVELIDRSMLCTVNEESPTRIMGDSSCSPFNSLASDQPPYNSLH